MECPKCHSTNVNIQQVNDRVGAVKFDSLSHKIMRGILIICTLGLWLLVPNRASTKIKSKTVATCQNCGHSWKV